MNATERTPWLELAPGLAMVPVAHGIRAFADIVREAVHGYQPRCIAVELPRALAEPLLKIIAQLPEVRVLAWRVEGQRALMIPADPCDSLIEAVRLATEHGVPLEFVDTLSAAAEIPHFHLPDPEVLPRIGLDVYTRECLAALPPLPVTDRERIMAGRLARLAREHGRVLFVGGMGHLENLRRLIAEDAEEAEETSPAPEVRTFTLGVDELGYVMREIPYVAWLYENFRSAHGPEDRFPFGEALKQIYATAAARYDEEYDETVNLTEWRAVFQYARNLAIAGNRVMPRVYEIITAAKQCVNDDFGAICFEVANSYPPNTREEEATTSDFSLDDFDDEDEEEDETPAPARHRSMNLYCPFSNGVEKLDHAYPFPELGELEFHFNRRPRASEAERLAWREAFGEELWGGSGICSWPPEDFFIENLFRKIRHRAWQQITENHGTIEEFTGSMLDGLDIRETMRNLHRDKIFVKRERLPPGKVGPVVLLWRDLPLFFDGLWRTCLYAENQNESDIAIYANPLGKEMVGPRISRTDYYGILSVFPARGIPNVWSFPMLHRWQTCGRLLIAAAVLLSEERYIACVASRPPDAELRAYARENGRSLIYLPLETFSRKQLQRARQCHILAGHDVRSWADQYIPKL